VEVSTAEGSGDSHPEGAGPGDDLSLVAVGVGEADSPNALDLAKSSTFSERLFFQLEAVRHALARSTTTTAPMTAADPQSVTYHRTRFSVQWDTYRSTR